MELWDVLDVNGEKTGETVVRGQSLKPGQFHLVVHIWIRNERGDYLIQKRADHLEWLPGIWATTGGSVISGEGSLLGAIRETREELGLDLSPSNMTRLARLKKTDSFVDIWLVRVQTDELGPHAFGSEVSETKWRSRPDILRMIAAGEFYDYTYIDLLPE